MQAGWLLAGALLCVATSAHAQFTAFIPAAASGGSAPTFQQGINMRNTSGYVTDANKTAYELATGSYPETPACNGCASTGDATSIGWNNAVGVNSTNINSGIDARLAGQDYVAPGGSATYEILTPGAGTYNVSVSLGHDSGAITGQKILVLDGVGGSTLATIGPTDTDATNLFIAADSAKYSETTWPSTGSTKCVTVTTTGTIIAFKIGDAVNYGIVTHIGVNNAGGGCGTYPPP